ncbi:MAG: hypothetical protein P1U36_02270 [Legionellaceae bacterium]|nr:hypothetical protein [Legionellaceae bacterium]
MITQEQFDKVIDLLGDVAMANLSLSVITATDADKSQFQTEFDNALTRYNQALKEYYQNRAVPSVYSSDYHFKHSIILNDEITHIINIDNVMKQLNHDFVLCDNTDKEFYTPHSYTGRYRGNHPTEIQCTIVDHRTCIASSNQTPEPEFFPILIPSFLMDVLSHFLTMLLASVLIGAGAAAIASGLGAVLGACLIVTGASLGTAWLGTNGLGLFSGPREGSIPPSSTPSENDDTTNFNDTPTNT